MDINNAKAKHDESYSGKTLTNRFTTMDSPALTLYKTKITYGQEQSAEQSIARSAGQSERSRLSSSRTAEASLLFGTFEPCK